MERNKNLIMAREVNHMTQKNVADDLGIGEKTIYSYENGRSEPKLKVLRKLAKLYGVSGDYILGLTDKLEIVDDDGRNF